MLTLILALAAAASPAAPVCTVPDGTRVHLELALTDQEKALGLMYRDSLPADAGMLFLFSADQPLPFWMKNTFIPLDLVWLDKDGKVVDVHADTPPCRADPCPSYVSIGPARTVLEVNGGFAAAHGVKPGAVLRFEGVAGYPVAGPKR
ncbi:MAG: DUF192 domain-containing protein [Thermoanaerobaculaceae bacterium]|nr:DUF192 domain-containing protein [Thermoanaerobaculaceae bacterium]TAM54556.1 MAG: DUF192 domain-containing protein [Acidobacteriota bacterium]